MIIVKNLYYKTNAFNMSIKALHILKGENAAVIGPSGSGKTTFLKLLAGLEIPDSGEILLNEKCVTKKPAILPHQRNISLLSQNFGLWVHLTSIQHLAFARSKGKSLEPDKDDYQLLEKFRIVYKAHIRPSCLSGGEPAILNLDKPVNC